LVGVLTDKNNIGFPNTVFDIRTEKQVFISDRPDNLIQTRFVNRQVIRIPLGDPLGIDIDNRYPIMGAFAGDHRHRRPAHITGTNTQDVSGKKRFHRYIAPLGRLQKKSRNR
jgi:hypothetical protein